MMLNLDVENSLHMEMSSFVGTSVAALGMTGSGKTNTVAVLIEEMLKQGLPMTIVDIEGEYWGLKEKFDLLIAGRSEHAELEIGPENAAQLAEVSLQRGISIILDLSDYEEEETYEFLLAYFQALWKLEKNLRKPYQIILEEAHEFIPQSRATPLKTILARIASRGRKRGLGVVLATQRSQKAEKDVLTQAAISFLHLVAHPTDMRVYKEIVPRPSAEVEAMVNALKPGDALVVFDRAVHQVHMRVRDTFHVGATPEFEQVAEPELRKIDTAMLKELQSLMLQSTPKESNTEVRQAKRIAELETLLKEREAEIATMRERIETLSKLSVNSPDTLQIEQALVKQFAAEGVVFAPESLTIPARIVESVAPSAPAPPPPKSVAPPIPDHAKPPLNEKKFQSFRRRFDQIAPRHRKMLKVLTEKQKEMSVRELAAWLNVEESSITGHPPMELLKLRMIERYRYTDGYHYQSVLRTQLEQAFSGIDVEMLIGRLFEE